MEILGLESSALLLRVCILDPVFHTEFCIFVHQPAFNIHSMALPYSISGDGAQAMRLFTLYFFCLLMPFAHEK